MQQFQFCEKSKQPRVLGLTATLINSNCKADTLDNEIKDLETTFLSKVATSVNEQMVKAWVLSYEYYHFTIFKIKYSRCSYWFVFIIACYIKYIPDHLFDEIFWMLHSWTHKDKLITCIIIVYYVSEAITKKVSICICMVKNIYRKSYQLQHLRMM